MIFFLLLLGALVCSGYSSRSVDGEYGGTFRLELPEMAHFVVFNPARGFKVKTLWNRDDPQASQDSRWKVNGTHLEINGLRKNDSGIYMVRKKEREELYYKVLTVRVARRKYRLNYGERFNYSFDGLPSLSSCNIYFTKYVENVGQFEIVHQGRLLPGVDQLQCAGFNLLTPCEIEIQSIQKSCSGEFGVTDEYDEKAYTVRVDAHYSTLNLSLNSGERFSFTFDHLPSSNSCNIHFYGSGFKKTEIVHHGQLLSNLSHLECAGFKLLKPCGIEINSVHKSCRGLFYVIDEHDDKALFVILRVEPPLFDPLKVGLGTSAALLSVLGCCVKYCCCGGSSSDKNEPADENAEPAVGYKEVAVSSEEANA
ncbi:uncharacterized protein KZ484_010141 [Pholidichthys leucotaenia]